MNGDQPDKDLIALPLGELLAAAKSLSDCCDRIPILVEPSIPKDGIPFEYKGSIPQASTCHTQSDIFRVPFGMSGVINRIAFTERYPGTLYGAHYMLLINQAWTPIFPRTDHNVGWGPGMPQTVHIEIDEDDLISIMVQCSWQPVVFTGQAATYVQTMFPFVLGGYLLDKNYFSSQRTNTNI